MYLLRSIFLSVFSNTSGFVIFSGGVERDQWYEMGEGTEKCLEKLGHKIFCNAGAEGDVHAQKALLKMEEVLNYRFQEVRFLLGWNL